MSQPQAHRREILIAGRTLKIQTDQSPERLNSICAYVNERYDGFRNSGLSQIQQTLLLALSIAEELFEERSKNERKDNLIEEQVTLVLQKLQEASNNAA